MIKVIIADDHKIIREGLKRYLLEASDIVITEEAANGQEVIKKVAENECDVVLLDISMPGMNGLSILKQLKINQPDIHILILSMHSEEEYAERALKAGASGYLTKNVEPDELIAAICKVSKGKNYITTTVGERLSNTLRSRFKELPHETLSDREYEVMCLISTGKTLTEIGAELSLSKKTISTHRAHIMEKMKMQNNAQLTHYAIKNYLVD
ncbi:MAG: response regulator [Planctomycetota bacterium]|jgi:DNA-binding NarL/FixJ family response regulator